MNSVVALSLLAAACAVVSGVLIAVMLKTGAAARLASDVPNERSLHATPVPRVGGIVVVAVAALCILVLVPTLRAFSIIALCLMFVSALDDRRGLPAGTRLAAHIAAASVASWLLVPELDWWSIAFTVIAIAWSINLYNFMDGADGMAGGMALFGFGTYACVAATGEVWPLALAAGAVVGASVGFLVHNLPPARIFLGDSGSVPFGFLAATMGLVGWRAGLWSWVFPVLVFAPFVIDATATLLLRAARRERIWEPHRDHLYQRIVLARLGQQTAALWWYVAMALCAIAGTVSISWPIEHQIALLGVAAAIYATAYATVSARARATR